MSEIRTSRLRRALPLLGGAAFVVILLVVAWRIAEWRQSSMDRERARIQSFVEAEVATWEAGLRADLQEHLEVVAANPDGARLVQRSLRRKHPWFNSLYVWKLGRDGHAMEFPPPPTRESREFVQSRFCIRRANAYKREVPVDPLKVAGAYMMGCRFDRNIIVRVHAATEAAYLLRPLGLAEQGLRALDMVGLPDASLAELTRANIPPDRVAVLRFARAELLLDLGRKDEGIAELTKLGREITQLNAPDLAIPLNFYLQGDRGIIAMLRVLGALEPGAQLERRALRAGRRLAAYKEVREQIVGIEPTSESEARFVRDQYSDDDPYLLYFGWAQGYGVALQIEQSALIEELMGQRMRSYRHHVTVLGERDQWVAGARRGGDFALSVPLTSGLSHLRLGLRESALETARSNTDEQSLVLLFVVSACAVLGLLALGTQMRLTKQQDELMNRQRAFTMRVTHELKTPLAGIRVMAENLEAGAFRDPDQRADMARRIVEEADRLTSRVDEVLSVSRQRTIPSPAAYDPEEAVLAAIDQWGPRLEDAGVKLNADLHPTDMVLGDCDAMRDAVGCLLDNALKYRHPERDGLVRLELAEDGRFVVIRVADNGIGVPKPMRRAIFQRFVRVEGPNRGKAGGHGLGLNQVREIVEAHRGTVQCVDGIDGGACFVIRVPALRVTAS